MSLFFFWVAHHAFGQQKFPARVFGSCEVDLKAKSHAELKTKNHQEIFGEETPRGKSHPDVLCC